MEKDLFEKGLLIDAGRKYWPVPVLKEIIQLMASLDMTHLQLHFSDNTGFRIESKQYPELVSPDYYRQEEILELVKVAAEQGIEIIPSLDSPGHLSEVLKLFPDYALRVVDEQGEEQLDYGALDVTNPEACQFMFGLYNEYADLFAASQTFHIGADEFIPFDKIASYPQLAAAARKKYGPQAGGLEPYVDYVNQLADLLMQKGKRVRVWNDGFFRKFPKSLSSLTKNVEVCYWTSWDKNMAVVPTWLDKGYNILNYCDNYLYYVLGENAGYTYPTVEKLEQHFTANLFSGGQRLSNEEMKQVKGCYFSVWSDIPEAKEPEEVLEDLKQLLPIFARKIN